MRERTIKPNAAHEAFLAELKATLGNSGAGLPADVLLAIASQFVGQLVALQDIRKTSPAAAMEMVARNIEIGNAEAVSKCFAGRS